MKTSTDRIITTHAGSLPRPDDVLELIRAKMAGSDYDQGALDKAVDKAVNDCVAHQSKIGIDIPADGELSKPSFLGYITERLGGITVTEEPFGNPWAGSKENNDWPEYYAWEASLGLNPAVGAKRVVCTADLTYQGEREVAKDVARFKAAMAESGVAEGFLPAISPSQVEFWIRDEHYGDEEKYLFALADALHEEYKVITDAGLILQIDDPRLVTSYVMMGEATVEETRNWADLRIEALNRALKGLPEEQVRFHTCYSIDMGPRTNDMELKDIVDKILTIDAGAYSFEGANPRHEHEWKVWKDVNLPDHKILIPGVITHSTILVEHPEVIADRIVRFASVVGKDRVIAGADCGFGTFAGMKTIHPTVAWGKLEALVEGAEIATKQLWN
jgi:5-methyltetrahydropteroyltriglutamate--homocysteine methyltransferase